MAAAGSVVWEELNVMHAHLPRCTSSLLSQPSSFSLLREGSFAFTVWAKLRSGFLPEGYPSSVTSDYLAFQFWDTLQGLSTYIRCMLSTQALLSAIGVGETTATAIGATFQWFLRDFTGMLGGILFTLYQGSNLDSKAKQWRLAADFMNDIGMLMDLVSPLFPQLFIILLCVGSLARSVTGVASGATRAALTQHFALQQNAADISAKEGSQETVATLLGMLLGMVLAHLTVGNPIVTWFSFLLLTGFHMFANYMAVRCLCLTSLNSERTSILLRAFLDSGKVLDPKEVSVREQLLPQYRFPNMKINKMQSSSIIFGARISALQLNGGWKEFSNLVNRYKGGNYLIVCEGRLVKVILHKDSSSQEFLQSFVHASMLSILMDSAVDDMEARSFLWMDTLYEDFLSKLKSCGWNTDRILIHPGVWRANWTTDDIGLQKKMA